MKSKNFVALKRNKDFKKVIDNRKTLNNNLYSMKYIENNINCFRLGISANKKKFKTAVLRNKIKRQIRTFTHDISIIKGYDVVLIVNDSYNIDNYIINKDKFVSLYNKLG
ncbi:MAG: ribonuclease P protein component [Mycoplasmataceae bacterium]|jgi:ribonuclease P protein component|nr:ribonuclease P protein component [Mycoplasmataceae bacterium]